MHRDLAGGGFLEFGRQGFIGGKHIGKMGVAADGRYFQRMQHRGLRRHVDIGHIGVPDGLAIAEIADRLTIHDDVGDDIELRKDHTQRFAQVLWTFCKDAEPHADISTPWRACPE